MSDMKLIAEVVDAPEQAPVDTTAPATEPTVGVKDQVLAALKEFGISTVVQESKAMERFYAVGRMSSQTRKKPFHTFDLATTSDKATVIPLTDIHLGSKFSLKDKFQAYIDLILNTPNCYTVVLGDVMENATKTSVGLAMYEENFHIEDQMIMASQMLQPLVNAGKLIGIHTGNHEQRTSLLVQLNPMKLVAESLGVPYLDWQSYHIWTVGGQKYKIHTHHGSGGGASAAGKLNQVMKMAKVSRADLFLMGHTHDRLDYETVIFDWDEESGEMIEVPQKYAVCGSLLGYHGSYAEQAMFPPIGQGMVKIDFYKNRKDIKIYK